MGSLDALKPGTDPSRPVHVVFVGAGAVGCFYASRLHHPTHNIHVSLIARSNYKALTENGVQLQTHTFGDYVFRPHAVFPTVAAAAANPNPFGAGPREWDYIIVTTKALPDRSDDSALIAPLVGPNSCIVLIQNGVGVEQPYRARFPTTPIISAVTVISAEQTSPGTVRQNRWTRIHLGPYSNSASFSSSSLPSASSSSPPGSRTSNGHNTTGALTPTGSSPLPSQNTTATATAADEASIKRLQALGSQRAALLSDWWTRLGGIRDVDLAADETALQAIRWHKLCINAAFNPSAVLSGGRGNADMVRDPELRAHLDGIMREIWEVAPRVLGGGRGFPASAATPEKILKSTERNVGSKPSMLLDWEAGRPMEIEVILGNPIRIARARGVEMPRLQTVYALVRSMQEVKERRKKEGGKL
ncbi:hypothetical protein VTI28DRAFT_10316 [Corynascus sepedonium]